MIHVSKETITSLGQTLPRRVFFKSMAFFSLVLFSTAPLYAKGSQKQFEYQSKPNDGKSCKGCMHFEAEKSQRKLIEGTISPDGWCTLHHVLQK